MLFAEISLGIQFWRDRVDLVLLAKGLRGLELLDRRSVELKPHGHFYAEGVDGVTRKLEALLTPRMLRAETVRIGLPRSQALSMPVEVPQVKGAEIRQIMRHELDRQLPLPAEDVYWDAQPAGMRGGALMMLLLAAVPRDRLDPFLAVMERLGLEPTAVELSTSAAGFLAAREAEDAGIVVALGFEPLETEITVLKGRQVVHCRAIRHPAGMADDPGEKELERRVEQVWNETARSLASAGGGSEPRSILLYGMQATDPNLASRLGRLAGLRCTYLNPFSPISSAQLGLQEALSGVAALGLAAQGLQRNGHGLNLLPPERRAVRSNRGLVLSGILIGLIAALLVVWVSAGYMNLLLTRNALRAGILSLNEPVQQVKETERRFRRVEEQIEIIRGLESRMPLKIEILRELSEIVPDGSRGDPSRKAWITFLEIEDRELTLRGKSESPEGLLKILDDSPYFERVRFESSVTGENFTIRANITEAADPSAVSPATTPTPRPRATATPRVSRPSRRTDPQMDEEPFEDEEEDSGPAYRIPPTPAPPTFPPPTPVLDGEEGDMTDEEEARQRFLDILRNSRDKLEEGPSGDPGDSTQSFLEILRGGADDRDEEEDLP